MNLFGSPAMVSRFASLEDDFGQLGKFTILHPSRAHELIVKYSMTRREHSGSVLRYLRENFIYPLYELDSHG